MGDVDDLSMGDVEDNLQNLIEKFKKDSSPDDYAVGDDGQVPTAETAREVLNQIKCLKECQLKEIENIIEKLEAELEELAEHKKKITKNLQDLNKGVEDISQVDAASPDSQMPIAAKLSRHYRVAAVPPTTRTGARAHLRGRRR